MNLLRRKRNRPFLVKILGAGPAGLFAAQAVYDMGGVVQLYARGRRSDLYGAQYLHAKIPGLDCGDRAEVQYILKGTPEGYRRKVYGPDASLEVSPDTLAPIHDAWDIRSAYGHAWLKFSGLIQEVDLKPQALAGIGNDVAADLVVWSIPLASQCIAKHSFASESIWAQGDAPELGRYCSVSVDPWTVLVNGEDSPRWYRASNVFGHRTAEWPFMPKPPVNGVALVEKPIATNCDCWLKLGGTPVLRVGRFGRWTKGELSHQAYERTRAALETM